MKENLVLIGMPGSGKTTLGKLLRQELNLSYIDIDDEIEERSEKKIAELFEISEEHFRDVETRVTKEISSEETSAVISTGGGVILKGENMEALKTKGVIIFIDRPLNKIAEDVVTETRPLLREEGLKSLEKLYNKRIHLYKKYADLHIKNTQSPKQTVDNIIKEIPDTFLGRSK